MALDFAAGCLGGCAGILVGHPLDTVKVHLQTQNQRTPAYRGAFDCFKHILHRESVGGLYRGMAAPLAGVAAVNAVTFGVYGLAARYLGADSLRGQFAAGALSGLAQSAICAPLEQLKTRAQLLGVGPLQCAADTLRREGSRGLFRGLAATVLRDTPAMGIYFATYEAMTRGSAPAPTWLVLAAGGTAGAASWLFTYPVDVLKSRLQADGGDGRPRRYSGMADCLRQSVRSDGWSFLTRGLGIVVVRAFPTNAACFFTVTLVLRWDQERRRTSSHGHRQLPPAVGEQGSGLLQLQPPRPAATWHRGHLDDLFGWRRSLARATGCGFLKLEGPAANREDQSEAAGGQYESVHRLFLHTADFTESSWLSSEEFLSPPEGDAERKIEAEQLAVSEKGEVGSKVADNLSKGFESEIVRSQSGMASSTSEEISTTVSKLDPKSDDIQIMGSPASGLVRKPDAVRHISRDAANRTMVATQVDLFQGYIVPPDDLWLDQGVGNHLERGKLAATRLDKSRSLND
ncbi:mitochondrial basic amino acids transporter-like [Schistocerca cancellata]|uniref:mitochondrial basic amino acids transporter-like n=1 Tax=Schistocerca cancellata TaxID=274614 RepID=UPI0021197688|nr:mitochondrial basic amino acids transporter-like [Schistocerca cancellata]